MLVWRIEFPPGAHPRADYGVTTASDVAAAICRHSFRYASEDELQAGVAGVLAAAGFAVEREVRLSLRDRIDLLVDGCVGVEVKIAGIPSSVERQMRRYAESDRLTGLVLVTNRARHRPAASMCGKPVVVASLLGAAL